MAAASAGPSPRSWAAHGWFVVTVDPLVTLEGTSQLTDVGETTADRIVAAGGSARASSASVTDGPALRALFGELAEEHGGLDAVVNVAGITRQSYVARGTEEDWLALLDVHLNGYLNVLEAALPLMAAAGHGRILGITSGSGWRAADAGGYSAAKRVVAALTWHLGRMAPPGVTINALSPIANTRMVRAAFERAQKAGHTGGGGGLTLDSMPGPEDVGPLGAHVVGDGFGWCSGQVLFAGGPEVAVVDRPRLVEAIRTHDAASLAAVLDAVVPRAFVAAEAKQTSDGGANPRFAGIFDAPAPTESTPGTVRRSRPRLRPPPPHGRSAAGPRTTLHRLRPRRRGPRLRRHRQVAACGRRRRRAGRRRDRRPRRPPAHLDHGRRMGARAGRPPGPHAAPARRRLLAPGCRGLHGARPISPCAS